MDATLLASALFETTSDGVLAFDRDCRYTAWNPVMERISGLSASEVLGQQAFSLFPFLVETGHQGLEAARAFQPHVIVCDKAFPTG